MLLVASCPCCGRRGAPVCPGCLRASAPAPVLPPPLHLDSCVAALDYHEARPLVTSLKNGNRRDLVAPLADLLAPHLVPTPGTVVTWAPTTGVRRRARGYDQAELLALALARRWGLPCRSLLERPGGTAQAGRGGRARRVNPSFRARRSPGSLVVVDDVVTTGATLTAAARALRAAGAATVHGAVVARAGAARS